MKRLAIVLLAMLVTTCALVALAAPRKKTDSTGSEKKSSRKHASGKESAAEKRRAAKEARDAKKDAGASKGPRAVGDAGAGVSNNVKEAHQGDGGSSYKFGELEIEGRLKTPQIVYFLRRVRAEFAAQDLGHRSFQGELEETKKESSF